MRTKSAMERVPHRLAALCVIAGLSLGAAPKSAPQNDAQGEVRERRELARGVNYRHLMRTTPACEPWSIHVVEVSRMEKQTAIRSLQAVGDETGMKREPPTEMARRAAASGLNIVAVVNGDYDLPAPYLGVSDGLSVTNGFVSTTGKPTWPAMAVTSSGEPVIGVPQVEIVLESRGQKTPIAALNKPLGTAWGSGLHLYTREFRTSVTSERPVSAVRITILSHQPPFPANGTVRGKIEHIFPSMNEFEIPANGILLVEPRTDPAGAVGSALPRSLRVGDKVKLRIRVQMNGRKNIRDVVGGFPILVEGGKKHIVGEPKASLAQRHPRTAVCYNERKIIFVVVDGRQPNLSVGMTLDELADLMVELGCTSAMNTDGGGSSVMAVKAEVGGQRSEVGKNTHEPAATATNAVGARYIVPLRIVNSPSDGQERGRGNAWIVVVKK